MKKILLFLTIALLSFQIINAQDDPPQYGFEKGALFITGSIGFSHQKSGDFKANGFRLAPSFGYFISDNISLDAGLIITSNNTNNNVQLLTSDTSGFGGTIGGTYFFNPTNQFSFTLGMQFLYQKFKSDSIPNITGISIVKTTNFGAFISPGLNYFITSRFALRTGLGIISYTSVSNNIVGSNDTNNFQFGFNLSDINFGVTYKI